MGKESYQDQINRNVLAINSWLSDLAAREQLLLIDLHGALADEDGRRRRREFIDADGTHITREGYDALTRYAAPILYEHLTKRRSPNTQ
jgi:lysophospholipase L1-like esterase